MRGASFKLALPIEKENQKYKNKKEDRKK